MNKTLIVSIFAASLMSLSPLAFAQATTAPAASAPAAPAPTVKKTLTPQQQKMKNCSAQAKTQALKGDARKTFMSTCLKAKPAA